jgi:hypothetical protein
LDDSRNILRIGELKDYTQATAYLKKITETRDVFRSLENSDYRNFIVSNPNYDLFLNRKNIAEYMDFYKKIYLEKHSSGSNR